jgi:spore photoproduct lyase
MKRHRPKGLTVAKNIEDILTVINNHAYFDTIEKPNQTDPEYITYDISCNEDFALHHKYYDWKKIFEFFRTHEIAKATLATKTIPHAFLEYNPERKVRIRFSLMPQYLSDLFEPNTPPIKDRIEAINTFIEAGYDVHINFSPVILEQDWVIEYTRLFEMVEDIVKDSYKPNVLSEVIFLTHNKGKHEENLKNGVEREDLLWWPAAQEKKISQYGGENVRYRASLKRHAIEEFRRIHDEIIPWNKIRYIF